MSFKKVRRRLESMGWEYVRRANDSHHLFRFPGTDELMTVSERGLGDSHSGPARMRAVVRKTERLRKQRKQRR